MLFNDRIKKYDIFHLLQQYEEELYSGNKNAVIMLYTMLVCNDSQIVLQAAKDIYSYWIRLNPQGIINFSETFRDYTSVNWFIDWKNVDLSDLEKSIGDKVIFKEIIRIGTFHPNGYFREKCVKFLKNDIESIKYITLRLNDWVENIRNTTLEILDKMMDYADEEIIISTLPYFDKVKQGERRSNEVYEHFNFRLNECIKRLLLKKENIDLKKISDYDFYTKRALYPILIKEENLPKAFADKLLFYERHTNSSIILINLILKNYDCSNEELKLYMKHKSAIVRRKALERFYMKNKCYFEGLEEYLNDSNRGVREVVCFILRKHTNFDILQFYIDEMDSDKTAVAILGIGENGSAKNFELIKKYLSSDNTKVVKNTVIAIGKLKGSESEDIYWEFMEDERMSVSTAAFNAAKASDSYYLPENIFGRIQKYENIIMPIVKEKENDYIEINLFKNEIIRRRHYFNLLLNDSTWKIMQYLIYLYNDFDDNILNKVRRKIIKRSYYSKVSNKEADNIRMMMHDEIYDIPEALIKQIEFDLKYVEEK